MILTALPSLEIDSWTYESLSSIVKKILNINQKPLVLIDGVAGSGKTTLAVIITDIINANLVHTDDVCWNTDPIHYDGEMLDGIINPWLNGNNVSYKPTGWIKENRIGSIEIDPNKALVIEGIGVCRKTLREVGTYSIWLDIELEFARNRLVRRDIASGADGGTLESITKFADWLDSLLIPFLIEEKPWKYVNLIVSGSESDLVSNNFLVHIIKD